MIWFLDTKDLINKFLGNVVCEDVLECMSFIAGIELCGAVCHVSLRTMEGVHEALASTGNQIREGVGVESSARSVQYRETNTKRFSECSVK